MRVRVDATKCEGQLSGRLLHMPNDGQSREVRETMANLTVEDRMELHEIAARYGDLMDFGDWKGLAKMSTDAAVFDATDLGMPLLEGLNAIRDHMDKSPNHPLGHHITNIYVEAAGNESSCAAASS